MKPLEETVTMDDPYRLSHEIHKPIIQNVKEIIHPYRNVVQQVKPVVEDIRTIVPQDNDVNHQHQQQQRPSYGGMSTKSSEWNPMVNRRPSHLKPPPPRPGFGKVTNRFPYRRPFDQVSRASEPIRVQRRVQFDDPRRRPHRPNHRKRSPPPMGRMQFGSSDIVYVPPMAPKTYYSRDVNRGNLPPMGGTVNEIYRGNSGGRQSLIAL